MSITSSPKTLHINARQIKILVVDDHALVLTALCEMLGCESDFEVVGSAANGEAALLLLTAGLQVDILLTDLNMRGMNGFELTREAMVVNKKLRVIILTIKPKADVEQQAVVAGAKASLSKDCDGDDLIASIRTVYTA